MNKILEKVLAQPIVDLKNANHAVTIGKWERAKAAYEIYNAINWKDTVYKSFQKFCEVELKEFKRSSLTVWIVDYKNMSKYYNWDEIVTISKEVPYHRVIRMLPYLSRKLPVTSFIKRVKAFNPPQKSNKFRTYSLNLNVDEDHAAMFEMLLIPYGYTPSNTTRRVGISEAFCQWLDNIFEQQKAA